MRRLLMPRTGGAATEEVTFADTGNTVRDDDDDDDDVAVSIPALCNASSLGVGLFSGGIGFIMMRGRWRLGMQSV